VGESPYRSHAHDGVAHEGTGEQGDSPAQSWEDYLANQMDWFLPNCLQKYPRRDASRRRESPFPDNLARERLAHYVLSVSFDVALRQPPPGRRRNAVHAAAYHNDAPFLRWIVRGCGAAAARKAACLASYCEDGGWTPLHYATAGGSTDAVELLLAEGAGATTRTERSQTCFNRYGCDAGRRGKGVTARELAIVLQSGAVDDDLMSDAEVLDEIVENRIDEASAEDKAAYMRILKSMEERLYHVEQYGYSPPKQASSEQPQRQDCPQALDDSQVSRATTGTNNKKTQKEKEEAAAATGGKGLNPRRRREAGCCVYAGRRRRPHGSCRRGPPGHGLRRGPDMACRAGPRGFRARHRGRHDYVDPRRGRGRQWRR